MKSVIVLSYKKLPQADLAVFASNVVFKMTNAPLFVSLKNSVDELKIHAESFRVALAEMVNGGKLNTLNKNESLARLLSQMDVVAKQVDLLSEGSEAVVLAAGFEVRKTPVSISEIAPPTNLKATNIPQTGKVDLSWDPVPGSTNFLINQRKKGEAEWRTGESPTAASYTVTGIPADTRMEFKVMTKTTKAIASDWSAVVEVMVT